jgi:ABC-type transporter Mla MlaB component
MSAAGDKLESRLVFSAAGTVRCRIDEKQVTLALEGKLDHETAAALVDAVTHELGSNPARIDIDLCGLTSFIAEGAQALARCREVCSQLPSGLHYRTDGGAGQLALLAAFEREPVVELE